MRANIIRLLLLLWFVRTTHLLILAADECTVVVAVTKWLRLDSFAVDCLTVVKYTRGTVGPLYKILAIFTETKKRFINNLSISWYDEWVIKMNEKNNVRFCRCTSSSCSLNWRSFIRRYIDSCNFKDVFFFFK